MVTTGGTDHMLGSRTRSCLNCHDLHTCLPTGISSLECVEIHHLLQGRYSMLRGEALYDSGDPVGDQLYVVKDGQFKISQHAEDGGLRVIGFRFGGDILGLDALGLPRHRTTVTALTAGVLCAFSYKKLVAGARQNEQLARRLNLQMGKELVREQRIGLLLAEKTAEQKLSRFLLSLLDAQTRRGGPDHLLELGMTRADIASYLGLTSETVSRTLSLLQQSGCLAISNRLISILDLPRLRSRTHASSVTTPQRETETRDAYFGPFGD